MPAKRKSKLFSIFFSASVSLLLDGCITKQSSYGIVGIPAISNDGKYIAAVVAESEGTTFQENGGYRPTSYSNIFWLKLYETATGKLLKKKKIYATKEPDSRDIICYGSFNNKIWLQGDGVQAYDINSLEEVVNQQKLAAANHFDVNNFPDEQRFIDAVLNKGYINFMAIDRENYRVNLADLKIIKPDATEKKVEKSISSILHHEGAYGIRCDTFSNTLFALAKDSVQIMGYNLANPVNKELRYPMHLFNAAFTIKQLGDHYSFNFFDVKQLGGNSYLNACFLKDMSTGNVVHLEQPAGYLIIHQDTVSSNARALLTRIDTRHNKIWETSTGVSTKIGYCTVNGKYCIIVTNTAYMFSPHIGSDALVIVDIETGKILRPPLSE